MCFVVFKFSKLVFSDFSEFSSCLDGICFGCAVRDAVSYSRLLLKDLPV